MTAERDLATFAAELTFEDIPEAVRDRTGLTVADTLGAIVGGSTDDAIRSLARRWTESVSGTATVLGTDGTETAPPLAAFCNGAAGTVLELDEGHRFAAGHPSIHVLPALLADAEVGYGNSEAFVRSFVAGYEVAVRTARALGTLESGYHPHGVWGAVGGAAAVARSRDLDPETTRTAMAIAANYAQHTRFEAATEGATVRNTYAGTSNLSGHLVATQAEAGFTGLDDGIVRHLGLAAADEVETAALSADLGDDVQIGERGLDHQHVCALLDIESNLAAGLAGVCGVHLVVSAVAKGGGTVGRVAKGTVKGRLVFRGVAHHRDVLETRPVESRADTPNHPVHHAGGRDHVRAGLGV